MNWSRMTGFCAIAAVAAKHSPIVDNNVFFMNYKLCIMHFNYALLKLPPVEADGTLRFTETEIQVVDTSGTRNFCVEGLILVR